LYSLSRYLSEVGGIANTVMLAFKIIMAFISEPLILSGVFNKVYLKSNQTRIQKQLKNKSQQKVGDQSTDKDAETAKSSI
jgi:hypothetical protein